MSDETARALLSGFISGAAAALVSTFVMLVLLSRSSVWQRLPENRRVPMPLVGVVFVNLMMLLWTAAGLILGALYLHFASGRAEDNALVPHLEFSLVVTAVIGIALATAAVIRGRLGTIAPLLALIAHLAFAWMLPNLAR
ncbi:MAG: hypothetical protein K1X87_09775 [Dehalococcoidia bacterium]|nr:hypothetical protein [Dehalococcoidia bacterium]HRC62538.1 hypothetical protein [Dehalococcoidia bacterium]